MPLAMVLFLVSLLIPMVVYLGPFRLLPHRIFLLIAFVPLLTRLLSGRAGRMILPDYLIAGSTVWAALAILASQPGPSALEPIGIHFVEFLGAYLVGRVAIRSADEFRRFVRTLFGLILLLIPFAALESFTHRAILQQLIPFSFGNGVEAGGPRWGLRRAQTVFAHPILYGTFVSSGLGLCWYALKPAAALAKRVGTAVTVFVATFFSLSSGAIVSFVVQSACIGWDIFFRNTLRNHWKIFLWCIAALYVLLDMASNRSPFHLLVDYATFSSSTAYYRIVIWRWGIDNVWAHPIFGLGLKISDWNRASWMGGSIDNFWLMIAMQYGIPAFLMMAGAIILIMYRMGKMTLADPIDRACRTGYLVSLSGMIVAGGTVHYWQTMLAFFMFLVGIGSVDDHRWRSRSDAGGCGSRVPGAAENRDEPGKADPRKPQRTPFPAEMMRVDTNDPKSVSYGFRKRRFLLIEKLIRTILAEREVARILDIGGTTRYWEMLDPALRPQVRLTVLNRQRELDLHRAENLGIAAEEVTGDGCDMPQFADGAFDLAHSNSVIEHVGSYANMIRFAAETRRVGRAYYVQTPYLWFPIEPHYRVPFLHWLPDAYRIKLHSSMNLGYARRCDYLEAMNRADRVRIVDKALMRALFPDGELVRERYMLMTKSITCLRPPVA